MSNEELMTRVLAPYQPQRRLEELVVEVNKIYHAFEAKDYDSTHPEITSQLPALWTSMISVATDRRSDEPWRVLDFGCGTGFEAEQLIRGLPPGSITHFTCYDPAPEMLKRAQARVKPLLAQAQFGSTLADLAAPPGGYNLLATNSLLHHLPNPVGTIRDLLPQLTDDARWLAGHEPSQRFYTNPACLRVYESFIQARRWQRFLNPRNYQQRLLMALGLDRNPTQQAARTAYRQGLFGRQPPARLIARLVDFYVANSAGEAQAGRGLDFAQLEKEFAGEWRLQWVRSYAFMGPFYQHNLPPRWARQAAELAARYPQDGANFSAVWIRP